MECSEALVNKAVDANAGTKVPKCGGARWFHDSLSLLKMPYPKSAKAIDFSDREVWWKRPAWFRDIKRNVLGSKWD